MTDAIPIGTLCVVVSAPDLPRRIGHFCVVAAHLTYRGQAGCLVRWQNRDPTAGELPYAIARYSHLRPILPPKQPVAPVQIREAS